MDFNLFSWVREGVRRSVLLGVSDAMETIGSPAGEDAARQRLSQLIEHSDALATNSRPAMAAAGGKRRLGRSLRDTDEG
jgi:hypothetical protein